QQRQRARRDEGPESTPRIVAPRRVGVPSGAVRPRDNPPRIDDAVFVDARAKSDAERDDEEPEKNEHAALCGRSCRRWYIPAPMNTSAKRMAFWAAVCLLSPRGAGAQQKATFLGPNECINCHDHQEERQWYEKKEAPSVRELFPVGGDKGGHINSLKQLDAAKGDPWAAAIGLKDKYDPNGACVRCH